MIPPAQTTVNTHTMTQATTASNRRKGLVILDVDGVLFKGQLLMALARRRGAWAFLRTIWDCVLFDIGRIPTEELLKRTYGRLRDMPWAEAWEVYARMPLTTGTAETIHALQSAGYRVILLTAGVPNPMVEDMISRLGADGGAGMDAATRKGMLTGRVAGELVRGDGKLRFVQRLVKREGFSWRNVVAVGDDPNNLPLMREAGVSVGFRATYSVRKKAQHLVEGDDLGAILPYVIGPQQQSSESATTMYRRPWRREILRKVLHLTSAAVPVLASRSLGWTSVLLLWAVALYLVTELWRVNGASLPLARRLAGWVMRQHDWRAIAMGPLTLALGVCVSLWCLPREIALACILIAAVADSVAAVVGKRWGQAALPYNRRKTVEGSAVFFASALTCALVYLPPDRALGLAILATLLESLPIQDWDNFITPVGTGLIAAVVLGW